MCPAGFFLEFEMSVHRKSTTNNNKIVKKAYILNQQPDPLNISEAE